MPKPDIVVVGASAGGVEALQVLVARLPAQLQASVFVVLHIGNGVDGESYLPGILSKRGPLPAVRPSDGERIEKGKIYVAPPDCHLLLVEDHVRLSRGPKENRTRPAINPLFRSAALHHGPRVIGVIMTGLLDDGVAGLAEIKRRGGLAIVEDPATALYPSMPANALQMVDVDHVVSRTAIGELLGRLTNEERVVHIREEPMEMRPSNLTCPECRGPLHEERQGKIVEFRCRVGHAYSPLAMEDEHRSTVERSLWATIVALEEAADISEMLGDDLGRGAEDPAQKQRERAAILRSMLTKGSGDR